MIRMRELPAGVDLLALHRVAPARYPLLLESVAGGNALSRWDLLLLGDGSGLRLDGDGVTRRLDGEPLAGRFLDLLDADWRRERLAHDDVALPFRGGWGLFLAYELAGQIEPVLQLPAAPGPLPVALALRCPAAVARDRRTGRCVALCEAGREDLLASLPGDLEAAARLSAPAAWRQPQAIREDAPEAFLRGVEQVHAFLRAGDVFQVNLSRAWRAEFAEPADPAALYARLREANPAPFAGLLAGPGWALASSSPERLVSVRAGVVETRPIAGTRPRLAGEDDAARIRELVAHPKERAEHVMLIDLERNDLGRVCQPGSVHVDEMMSVESYTHVHHIVSNISGRLRDEVSPGEVIAAVFPGGTITGCPKVRCMEIIAELEQTGRGPYTGALGYISHNGNLDFNILIRTFARVENTLYFRAGAGIVMDSVSAKELLETRAKAKGMLRALI